MHPLKTALALSATVFGLACASAPAPNEQLASAEASVRAAHELGAENVPRAELHLKLAQEQVTQARKLAEDGESERAAQVLTRARADAELALALAKEAAAHKELETVPASALNPTPALTPTSSTAATGASAPAVSVVQ